MKIKFDDVLDGELQKFLLSQDGIEYIDLKIKDFISEINIGFNKTINPKIIINYIYLLQNKKIPTMLEFDKCIGKNYKVLTYVVDDMCCEYCYKGLIQDLFDNEFIISVNSNFDFYKPAYNIEFLIKYSDNYDEEKLVQYIKEKINL